MRSNWPKLSLTWISCAVVSVAITRGEEPSGKGVAYFETHIRPLLVEHCYECHSSQWDRSEGGLQLDTRQGWSTGGEHGPAVEPGNVEASLLVRAVRYTDSELRMPPDSPLANEAIARLEHWVRMGAPDPRTDDVVPARHTNPSDPVAGKEHWAYRPLQRHQPPAVALSDWPRSTIDSFILARLEASNLHPAVTADRRVLLRRVYFALLGLPPSGEQIESFLNDDRVDALARRVDQLLSSPHFGEHWGRHWLDLARYADSNGLDENFLFREAWRYRNWTIEAVNADIPFDRFVMEQIAGDLVPFDSTEQRDRQRTAAGFLVVGPKVLLGNDEKNQRMEIADEQLDTIGRAILGQTLGCARCHDHKFDPVPTADYYAMAGILTSTQVVEKRYMLGQQRVMERLVGLGDDGDRRDESYEQYWRDQPALKARRSQAKSALESLEKGDLEALQKLRQQHADAVATNAADVDQPLEARIDSQKALLAEIDRSIANPAPIPPRAMIPADVPSPADEHIRLAGQFDRLGDQVPRGFLKVLCNSQFSVPAEQSGRIELGRWLTDEQGAGPLAARVLANRVWHHLIGRGVVRTVDNFGRTGESPTHPELLDYLAWKLVDSGWSVKELVRTIVLSRTFAMSSGHDDAGHAIDPDNELLWRAHRRRLSPESLRDAMLMAAGNLDFAPMESSVWYLGDQATAVGDNKNRRRTDFPCRSVYLPVIRNDLPELFEVFDFADPHVTTGMRPETMIATQGLYLLNAECVMDAAASTARRLLAGPDQATEMRVDRAYELILGAVPTDNERDQVAAFVRETEKQLIADGDHEATHRAWSIACQAILASSRFQIME